MSVATQILLATQLMCRVQNRNHTFCMEISLEKKRHHNIIRKNGGSAHVIPSVEHCLIEIYHADFFIIKKEFHAQRESGGSSYIHTIIIILVK